MRSGELYVDDDPTLWAERERAERLQREYATVPKTDHERRAALLTELFGSIGPETDIVAPVHCDYGSNIHIGARSFMNFGAVLLDVAEIRIGDDVMIGPNVQLLTPFHPTDPQLRRQHWEGAQPITIEDNVWLGGGVIVCPGVTIGQDSIVGAGSVVTRDVPSGVIALGSPAKVVRSL